MKKNSFCLVTCVKNEGPFLLEWISHCLGIGVTDFLIFTNHCDDYSSEILDRLDEMGIVRHLSNPSVFSQNGQHHRTALAYAPYHKEFQRSEYIIFSDSDEFIVSTIGDGSLSSLVEGFDYPDVISLCELNFGFGDNLEFTDELVTQKFRRSCNKQPSPGNLRVGVKSIMKRSDKIEEYANHRPVVREKDADSVKWLDGSGRQMGENFIKKYTRGLHGTDRYEKAWVNHYTLRSGESMLAKLDRGDAVRGNRLNNSYFVKRNGNEAEYSDIDANLKNTLKHLEILKSDSQLSLLHAKSVEAHKKKIEALKKDPKNKETWASICETVELGKQSFEKLKMEE